MNTTEYNLVLVLEELTEVAEAALDLLNHHLTYFAGRNFSIIHKKTKDNHLVLLSRLVEEANDLAGSYVNHVRHIRNDNTIESPLVTQSSSEQNLVLMSILKGCTKAQHTTCKAARFGLHDSYTGDVLNNEEILEETILKLFGDIERYFKYESVEGFLDQLQINNKLDKINKFKMYSIKQNKLQT